MQLSNFTAPPVNKQWEIVNDTVMGGHSTGHIDFPEDGRAVFHGTVSLEDNGGFTLVRRSFDPLDMSKFTKVRILLRGDGKRYQFRVKADTDEKHAYVQYFETNGEWQTVEIRLAALYPTYKGRRLEIPNFPGQALSEIGFLIGNKKAESFRLEFREIHLQ